MSVPFIFLGALCLLVLAPVAAAFFPDKGPAERFLKAVFTAAAVIMMITICLGLWEAWSPWELTPR